jgi:hypothetical protein
MKQLQLDLDGAVRDQEDDDMLARIRAAVTEDGMSPGEVEMSPGEVEAAVDDAFDRLGLRSNGAAHAQPCLCESGPMLFVGALAVDRRCARCGREPR